MKKRTMFPIPIGRFEDDGYLRFSINVMLRKLGKKNLQKYRFFLPKLVNFKFQVLQLIVIWKFGRQPTIIYQEIKNRFNG